MMMQGMEAWPEMTPEERIDALAQRIEELEKRVEPLEHVMKKINGGKLPDPGP